MKRVKSFGVRLRQLLRRVVEPVDDLGHGCDGLDGGVVRRVALGALENDQHARLLLKKNRTMMSSGFTEAK